MPSHNHISEGRRFFIEHLFQITSSFSWTSHGLTNDLEIWILQEKGWEVPRHWGMAENYLLELIMVLIDFDAGHFWPWPLLSSVTHETWSIIYVAQRKLDFSFSLPLSSCLKLGHLFDDWNISRWNGVTNFRTTSREENRELRPLPCSQFCPKPRIGQ